MAALVVTWNRKSDVDRCLRAMAAQTHPAGRIDVVVVDNASTDGTSEHILSAWKPERVVQNTAERPDEPGFSLGRGVPGKNAGGFRSLTLVRNQTNLGGCGGFNTAFLMVERTIAAHRQESMVPEDPRLVRAEPLEYVWLVDDDAEPARDCLARLVAAADGDASIGIVGSRMVDPTDRQTTLESLVYFNPSDGMFGAPGPGHPRGAEYQAWVARVGEAKGRHDSAEARAALTGVMDVECVAACSMLARWSMARQVGYWDARFFIAGDDADWCLRFLGAGHRVVCCLDSVVYHLPWSRKQTPTQDYYRRRNLLWTWQRVLPEAQLRTLTRARHRLILRQAWEACWRGRAVDAEVLRRTVHDAITSRGGRLDLGTRADGKAMPIGEAFAKAAGGRAAPEFVVVCPNARAVRRGLRVRSTVAQSGWAGAKGAVWTLMAPAEAISDRLRARLEREGIRHIHYGHRRRSKLKRQMRLAGGPPAAWVIVDGRTDVPIVRPARVVHIESRAWDRARLERGRPGARLGFAARWLWTWALSRWHVARMRPVEFAGRFGTERGAQAARSRGSAKAATAARTSPTKRGGGEELGW